MSMKNRMIKLSLAVVILMLPILLFGQTDNQTPIIGYQDSDRDGFNDRFRDANGDGVNDVTNLPYLHQFKFEDKNRNGLNDLWIDRDGDGVNDLMFDLLRQRGVREETPWIDKDGDGIQDENVKPKYKVDLKEFVLDLDGDGKNDISGIEFFSDNTMGYRYGCIDEDRSKEIPKFRDADGDGMHDPFANRFMNDMQGYGKGRKFDYFIDKDGDGISDGRGYEKFGKQRKGQGHGRKKN
jgi:hypothetical protein